MLSCEYMYVHMCITYSLLGIDNDWIESLLKFRMFDLLNHLK